MNLREAHGWTYGARSGMGVDKYTDEFKPIRRLETW
jgi:hypothetical protein